MSLSDSKLRILLITNKWPTADKPHEAPFLGGVKVGLEGLGHHVERFTFRGAKSPHRYAQAWRRLRQQFDLACFDVLHALFGQCGLVALPASGPLVVSYYGSDLHGDVGDDGNYTRRGRIMRQVSRFVAGRASANIVVSPHMLPFLPSQRSAYVVPCGVDLQRFRPIAQAEARARLDLPLHKRLLLFAADPQRPVKRFALAQAAVSLVQREISDVELLTLGNVDYDEMPYYMNAADGLLLTSRHEGSPTVVKEALACNLPVVSVDVGDVRQRLAQIDGCYVSDSATPEAVAAALRRLLARGQPIAGRPAVAELADERLAVEIEAIYRSVLR